MLPGNFRQGNLKQSMQVQTQRKSRASRKSRKIRATLKRSKKAPFLLLLVFNKAPDVLARLATNYLRHFLCGGRGCSDRQAGRADFSRCFSVVMNYGATDLSVD